MPAATLAVKDDGRAHAVAQMGEVAFQGRGFRLQVLQQEAPAQAATGVEITFQLLQAFDLRHVRPGRTRRRLRACLKLMLLILTSTVVRSHHAKANACHASCLLAAPPGATIDARRENCPRHDTSPLAPIVSSRSQPRINTNPVRPRDAVA